MTRRSSNLLILFRHEHFAHLYSYLKKKCHLPKYPLSSFSRFVFLTLRTFLPVALFLNGLASSFAFGLAAKGSSLSEKSMSIPAIASSAALSSLATIEEVGSSAVLLLPPFDVGVDALALAGPGSSSSVSELMTRFLLLDLLSGWALFFAGAVVADVDERDYLLSYKHFAFSP